MDIKIKKLKLIEKTDTYPDGANSPTVITKYVCPCGKGQIIDENVVGFNDRVIYLKCKNCLKKLFYLHIINYFLSVLRKKSNRINVKCCLRDLYFWVIFVFSKVKIRILEKYFYFVFENS